MIAYIKGTVEAIEPDAVVVECGGIGYQINFASSDQVALKQSVLLYIYEHIREDEDTLYGFLTRQQRELFVKLISVKGLGPKTAMGILRSASYEAIVAAIEEHNLAFIKSMPGIGNKTASQILLDLKGKLIQSQPNDKSVTPAMQDALDALKTLGYKQSECAQVMKYWANYPGKTTDEYVKIGLQYLFTLQ